MIEEWSIGGADACMPEDLLVEVQSLVARHPWWNARAKLALAVLAQNQVIPRAYVLDVGCGWGTNLDALEAAGYEVAGMDISKRILHEIDRPARRLILADITQTFKIPKRLPEAIIALDVIEHIDDDRAALQNVSKLLPPGGTIVVSVPALPDLYSEFDSIQGHRRRYLPETLRAAFENTGFAIQTIFWWGAWMVPVLRKMRAKASHSNLTSRTYSDYLQLPALPLRLMMKMAFAFEQRLAITGKLSYGTSLFAVAKRSAAIQVSVLA